MKSINKFILFIAILTAGASCIKEVDVNEGIASTEKTLIKLPQAAEEISGLALDAVNATIEPKVLEIRKDAISQNDLNVGTTVKIKRNPNLLTAYNAAHGTSYQELTGFQAGTGSSYDGTNWTVPFASGEFVKYLTLKFNPASLDLSKKYALGFTVIETDNGAISSMKDALVEIVIKNEYHGTYLATGTFMHPTAGDRPIDELKDLETTGPKSVIAPLGDLGGAGYYMILTVNADNTVTITKAGVTPNIDQSWGPNTYDPVTKTYDLFYSYNTAAPRKVKETLTMK
jgi:hypothetical protein